MQIRRVPERVVAGGAGIGPLALVADLDRRPGGGQHPAPRVITDRPGQRGASRGERAGQVLVLVAQRQRVLARDRADPGDPPSRITGDGDGGSCAQDFIASQIFSPGAHFFGQ